MSRLTMPTKTPTVPSRAALTAHFGFAGPSYSGDNPEIAWKSVGTGLAVPRYFMGAVRADQKVIVIGGVAEEGESDTVETFDVDAYESITMPLMHLPFPRSFMVTVRVPSGSIYVIGGSISPPPKTCYERDPGGDWYNAGNMPEYQGMPAGALGPDGKIYLIGGVGLDGVGSCGEGLLDIVQSFDPDHLGWESAPPLPAPRYKATAATSGNKIYVFGGVNACGVVSRVDEYDPGEGTWKPTMNTLTGMVSEMPTPRWALPAVTASNGRIYLIGGVVSCASFTDAVEEFNPADGSWRTMTPMPTARAGAAAVAANGRIFVLGGGRIVHSASLGTDIREITGVIEEGRIL